MSITVTVKDSKILVESPYNAGFVDDAHQAMGEWNGSVWVFDESRMAEVNAALLDAYGWVPDSDDKVRVRVTFTEQGYLTGGRELMLMGRCIGRYRKPGAGVRFLKGGLEVGGSKRRPRTETQIGTVLEIDDVPRLAFEQLRDNPPFVIDAVEIIEEEVVV